MSKVNLTCPKIGSFSKNLSIGRKKLMNMSLDMLGTLWKITIDVGQLLHSKGRFTPRGRANSPWGQLHEISAYLGLEAGLNYTL